MRHGIDCSPSWRARIPAVLTASSVEATIVPEECISPKERAAMPVVYFFLVMISCLGAPVSRAADPFPADNDFIRKAERAGNQEIADARAALATSKDPAVRNLAQQMEGDGTAVNQRLATLAVEKGWPAPSLDPPDAIGPYSDHRYVARQIRAERHALAFYAEEAANGADTALQEFARNTVSVFRQRLAALRLLVST